MKRIFVTGTILMMLLMIFTTLGAANRSNGKEQLPPAKEELNQSTQNKTNQSVKQVKQQTNKTNTTAVEKEEPVQVKTTRKTKVVRVQPERVPESKPEQNNRNQTTRTDYYEPVQPVREQTVSSGRTNTRSNQNIRDIRISDSKTVVTEKEPVVKIPDSRTTQPVNTKPSTRVNLRSAQALDTQTSRSNNTKPVIQDKEPQGQRDVKPVQNKVEKPVSSEKTDTSQPGKIKIVQFSGDKTPLTEKEKPVQSFREKLPQSTIEQIPQLGSQKPPREWDNRPQHNGNNHPSNADGNHPNQSGWNNDDHNNDNDGHHSDNNWDNDNNHHGGWTDNHHHWGDNNNHHGWNNYYPHYNWNNHHNHYSWNWYNNYYRWHRPYFYSYYYWYPRTYWWPASYVYYDFGYYPYTYYYDLYPHHYWISYPTFSFSFTYNNTVDEFSGIIAENDWDLMDKTDFRLNIDYSPYLATNQHWLSDSCPMEGYGLIFKQRNGEYNFYHFDSYGNRLAQRLIDRYDGYNRKIHVVVRGYLNPDTHTIRVTSMRKDKWVNPPVIAVWYRPFWFFHRPIFWF